MAQNPANGIGTAPDPECFIIPGSLGQLFIAANGEQPARYPVAADTEWVRISDLDNYTVSFPSSDTSLNSGGWIRSMVMERGFSVTATGRMSTMDRGQRLVNLLNRAVGCDAMGLFRFFVPGAHEGDPAGMDYGFWATPVRQDTSAGSSDPFTWGVALAAFQPPIELDGGEFPDISQQLQHVTGFRGGDEATPAATQQQTPQQQSQQSPQQQSQHQSRRGAAA